MLDAAVREQILDRLIAAGAGHVRDLLRLLQETLKRAVALPLTTREVDSVINAGRRDFLPLALDDAQWLAEIGRQRDAALARVDEATVERLSRFLDSHLVMYFVNDEAWYDTHPLIREEIARVLGTAAAAAPHC